MSSEHNSRGTDEDTEVLGRAKGWGAREVNIAYLERPEGQKGKFDVMPDSSDFKIDTLNIGNVHKRPKAAPLPQQTASAPAPATSTLAPPIPPQSASYGGNPASGAQLVVNQGTPSHTGATFSQLSNDSRRPPSNAPEFKHGIVAAIAAHTHLHRKTDSINTLLRTYGIEAGEWVGQVGFRLEASRDGDDTGADLPPVLRQEIVITLPKYRAVKGRRRDLVAALKERVSPFCGVVQFANKSSKRWDLDSETDEAPKTNSSDGFLVSQFSRPSEYILQVDDLDDEQAPLVKLSAINFVHNTNPGNHFTTSAAFTLEKENATSLLPSKIKFSELKFEGPSHYTFQSASARIIMDQPSGFDHVLPPETYETDPIVPIKSVSQKTTKKDKKHTGGIDVSPKSAKLSYQLAKGSGEEDMNSTEMMKNPWQVRHSTDKKSKTIRYFMSARPTASGHQMSMPDVEQLRPSMRFAPETRASTPKKVVVRLWSFWTGEESQSRSKGDLGVLGRVLYPLVGKSGTKGKKEEVRVYTNVAHCIEATVPLGFIGAARKTEEGNVVLEDLWKNSA